MQVFHTEGLPPSSGRRIFPASGCSRKRSEADVKIAIAKSHSTRGFRSRARRG